MKQSNISFRTDVQKVEALDILASSLDRDRSYVINEAITAYLELHQWQINHIKKGIKQADAGEFASDEEVAKVFKRRSH